MFLEAAEEGVDKNYRRGDDKTDQVHISVKRAVRGLAEEGGKQLCARVEGGRGVDRKEDRDDHCGYDLDDTVLVAVAVLEEAGDGQRVARHDGVFSQSGRNDEPV